MAFIIVGNYCALTYFFELELKLPSVIDMSQSFILFLFLFLLFFFNISGLYQFEAVGN